MSDGSLDSHSYKTGSCDATSSIVRKWNHWPPDADVVFHRCNFQEESAAVAVKKKSKLLIGSMSMMEIHFNNKTELDSFFIHFFCLIFSAISN